MGRLINAGIVLVAVAGLGYYAKDSWQSGGYGPNDNGAEAAFQATQQHLIAKDIPSALGDKLITLYISDKPEPCTTGANTTSISPVSNGTAVYYCPTEKRVVVVNDAYDSVINRGRQHNVPPASVEAFLFARHYGAALTLEEAKLPADDLHLVHCFAGAVAVAASPDILTHAPNIYNAVLSAEAGYLSDFNRGASGQPCA